MTSAESTPGASRKTPPADKPSSWNLVTLLLLLMAVLGLATVWGTIRHKSAPVDFYQYWVVGQVIGRPDVANIYSEPERLRVGEEFYQRALRGDDSGLTKEAGFRRKLEAVYSPMFYSLFKACSSGKYGTDLRNYRLLLLGSFTFGLILFARLTGCSWPVIFGLLVLFCVWFDPLYSDMAVGNVNGFQLAMLAGYVGIITRLRWKCRDLLGGLCLALALAFKPTLVFVAAMLAVDWIIRAQWPRLGWHILGGFLGFLVAAVISWVGFRNLHCWTDWISALRVLPTDVYNVGNGNYAPSRLVSERLEMNASLPLAIVYGGLAIAGSWWRRRSLRGGQPATREAEALSNALPVATGCLLLLLTSPLAWVHYYVLAVPVFVVLLSPAAAQHPTVRPAQLQRFLVLLVFLCFSVNLVTDVGIKWSNATWGILTAVGMSVLFLLAAFARVESKKRPTN